MNLIQYIFPGSFDSHQQKNNLVFHGIEPDKMEKDMAMVGKKKQLFLVRGRYNLGALKMYFWCIEDMFLERWRYIFAPQEPDFCRDILETRIKMLLREHLKISRDISFFKVGLSRQPPVTEISFSPRQIFQSYNQLQSFPDKHKKNKMKSIETRWQECPMPQKMQKGLDL